ncbi:hypothetical protein A7E05_16800 [Salmonella enterica]|nr:hypothetical protein [Salmonella enterica]
MTHGFKVIGNVILYLPEIYQKRIRNTDLNKVTAQYHIERHSSFGAIKAKAAIDLTFPVDGNSQ